MYNPLISITCNKRIMVELEILWAHDGDSQLEELGLPVEPDYTNTRLMTFYNINAISPHYENNMEFTLIHSNNNEFMCVLPYKEVKEILSQPLLILK